MKLRFWQKKQTKPTAKPQIRPTYTDLQRSRQPGFLTRLRTAAPFKQAKPQYTGSSSNFIKQRQQQRRWAWLRTVKDFISRRWRVGLLAAGGVALLVLGGAIAVLLHQSEAFILKEIEIFGTNKISKTDIEDELHDLKGRGMFTFSASGLEAELQVKFPYIKTVIIRKMIPSKIEVDIEERFPTLAYVSMSGTYLVDDTGQVVDVLRSEHVDALSAEDNLILSGYGDPEAEYVYERYLASIDDEEERKRVVWEEVDIESKRQALQTKREELLTFVENRLDENSQLLTNVAITNLLIVQGFEEEVYEKPDSEDFGMRYRMYKVGQQFDMQTFMISKQIAEYLNENGLAVSRLRWDSQFTLSVRLIDNTEILFTSTRTVNQQLVALESVRRNGDLAGASIVDLRSDLVAVR